MDNKTNGILFLITAVFCIYSLFRPNIITILIIILICLLGAREISKRREKTRIDNFKIGILIFITIVLFGSFVSYLPTDQPNGTFNSVSNGNEAILGESFYLLAVEGYDAEGVSHRINETYQIPAGGRYLYNQKAIEQNEFNYELSLESDFYLSNISIDIYYTDSLTSGDLNHYVTLIVPITRTGYRLVQGFPTNVSIIETDISIELPAEISTKIILFQITANVNQSAYHLDDADLPPELIDTNFPRFPYYKPASDNWLDIIPIPNDDEFQTWGYVSGEPIVSVFSLTNYPYPHLIIISSSLIALFVIMWVLSLFVGGVRVLKSLFFLIVLIGILMFFVQLMLWEQDALYRQLYQFMDNVPKILIDWATIEVFLQIVGMFIQVFNWAMTIGLAILVCYIGLSLALKIRGDE